MRERDTWIVLCTMCFNPRNHIKTQILLQPDQPTNQSTKKYSTIGCHFCGMLALAQWWPDMVFILSRVWWLCIFRSVPENRQLARLFFFFSFFFWTPICISSNWVHPTKGPVVKAGDPARSRLHTIIGLFFLLKALLASHYGCVFCCRSYLFIHAHSNATWQKEKSGRKKLQHGSFWRGNFHFDQVKLKIGFFILRR